MMDIAPVCVIPGASSSADIFGEVAGWSSDADWRAGLEHIRRRSLYEPFNIVWWVTLLRDARVVLRAPGSDLASLGHTECHLVFPWAAEDLERRAHAYWMGLIVSPQWRAFPAYWRREFTNLRMGHVFGTGLAADRQRRQRGSGDMPLSMREWIDSRIRAQLAGSEVHWAPRWAVEWGGENAAELLRAGNEAAKVLLDHLDANAGVLSQQAMLESVPGAELLIDSVHSASSASSAVNLSSGGGA